MRILNLITSLTGGGAERQLQYVAGELQRRGHEVTVAYAHRGIGDWQGDPAVLLHEFRSGHAWSPLLLREVISLIRAVRPQVIQTWIVRLDVIGGFAAALTRTPWVLREPTDGVHHGGRLKSWMRLAVAKRGADAVVANSLGGLEYWSRNAPALTRYLIPNAIPFEAIDDAAPADVGGRRIGLFAGRLEPLKNVDVMLRAAAVVMREIAFELIICGEGPDRERLEAICRDLGIADRVRFTGHTPEVWRYMKAAELFVSLSDFEGAPNAVLEAFTSGTPVILSDIQPHRALGEDCSWFARLRDVESTAQAMRDVLTDPGAAQARARKARPLMQRQSLPVIADAYEAVYEAVLRRKGA